MPVTVILRQERLEASAPATVAGALHELHLSPQNYLVLRDGRLVDADEPLEDGDVIRLVGVISGGQG
ncbi:MAG TPA: MoaD/ThiS family protein [Anaerolinea sp.]|nr:MoaD/ThiS family protein [Anaerolinea sp.]